MAPGQVYGSKERNYSDDRRHPRLETTSALQRGRHTEDALPEERTARLRSSLFERKKRNLLSERTRKASRGQRLNKTEHQSLQLVEKSGLAGGHKSRVRRWEGPKFMPNSKSVRTKGLKAGQTQNPDKPCNTRSRSSGEIRSVGHTLSINELEVNKIIDILSDQPNNLGSADDGDDDDGERPEDKPDQNKQRRQDRQLCSRLKAKVPDQKVTKSRIPVRVCEGRGELDRKRSFAVPALRASKKVTFAANDIPDLSSGQGSDRTASSPGPGSPHFLDISDQGSGPADNRRWRSQVARKNELARLNVLYRRSSAKFTETNQNSSFSGLGMGRDEQSGARTSMTEASKLTDDTKLGITSDANSNKTGSLNNNTTINAKATGTAIDITKDANTNKLVSNIKLPTRPAKPTITGNAQPATSDKKTFEFKEEQEDYITDQMDDVHLPDDKMPVGRSALEHRNKTRHVSIVDDRALQTVSSLSEHLQHDKEAIRKPLRSGGRSLTGFKPLHRNSIMLYRSPLSRLFSRSLAGSLYTDQLFDVRHSLPMSLAVSTSAAWRDTITDITATDTPTLKVVVHAPLHETRPLFVEPTHDAEGPILRLEPVTIGLRVHQRLLRHIRQLGNPPPTSCIPGDQHVTCARQLHRQDTHLAFKTIRLPTARKSPAVICWPSPPGDSEVHLSGGKILDRSSWWRERKEVGSSIRIDQHHFGTQRFRPYGSLDLIRCSWLSGAFHQHHLDPEHPAKRFKTKRKQSTRNLRSALSQMSTCSTPETLRAIMLDPNNMSSFGSARSKLRRASQARHAFTNDDTGQATRANLRARRKLNDKETEKRTAKEDA